MAKSLGERLKGKYYIAESGCWIWTGQRSRSRGMVRYNSGHVLAHRASFAVAHNRLEKDIGILRHSCDNPSCINPSHLIEGTQRENILDRVHRTCGTSLKLEQVLEIKELLKTKNKHWIAKKFGVHERTIRDIKSGRTWKEAIEFAEKDL